jgi:hypothetical protein
LKDILIKIFWPILGRFEKGDAPFSYKASSRTILLIVGILFGALSGGSLYFSILKGDFSAFLPILVFFGVALVCLVVGGLGSDRAVATLWGNAKYKGKDK